MTHKNLSLGKCWKLFLASLTTKLQNRGKIWTGYLAEEMQRKTRTKKSHKESTLEVDSSVPLRIQSRIFLKKRTLGLCYSLMSLKGANLSIL